MKTLGWRFIPLVLFVLLVIFFWRGLSLDPHHIPSSQINKPIPVFSLPLINDNKTWLTPADFHGHMTLLTIWASWCDACTREQAFLLKLKQSGIIIYGINYKDSRADATKWLAEWGNPYQLVAEDMDGRVAIDLGVYGAPETFLVDKKGVIRYRHVGVLDEKTWQMHFVPLMRIKSQ